MSHADPANLLDVIAPPEGFVFHAGVWLTHDLDWSALCDLVAPALGGLVPSGDRRMLDVRAAIPADAPGLVVLHAGGPHFHGGPVLPWAHEIAVTGRRQHAKAALLLYRSATGRTTRATAVVMSANLTRSGLTSNLEVMTWDESKRSTSPFLGVDVLHEVTALAETLPTPERLQPVLAAMQAALQRVPPTGSLTSSLIAETAMVPANADGAPAERVVVVSPAFAGNTDQRAASALAPWCGPGTTVDLFTEFDGPKALAVSGEAPLVLSKGLLRGLRRTGATVHVHAIPNADADGGPSRRLHAKVVAIVPTKGPVLLATGSANCTGPGLLGQNREFMVQRQVGRPALDGLVEGLDAVPFNGAIAPTTGRLPRPTVPDQVDVTVRFEIDPSARADDDRLRGTFVVEGDEAVALVYEGHRVSVGEVVDLDPEVGSVMVRSNGRASWVQIDVHPPDGLEFWHHYRSEHVIDHPDADLVRLLADVARATAITRTAKASKEPPATGGGSGGFVIPLSQRLVLLARKRQWLRGRSGEDVVNVLDRYLDGRSRSQVRRGIREDEVAASRAVVLAIHRAYDDRTKAPEHPLLQSLSGAIAAFDTIADDTTRGAGADD
jgi:hypothetical protein